MRRMKYQQQLFYGHYLHHAGEKIEHIKWCDSYSLGIKLVDDQHKELLRFVNDLCNHSSKNPEDELAYFKDAMGQVVDYIKIHFTTEEGIMLATRFPGYTEHKRTHENFILTVVKSARDYEDGKRLVLTNFSNFMRKWVLTHIAVMDVKYIEYFKNITISKADVKRSMPIEEIIKPIDERQQMHS